ncbi:50S ribosomal protein L24 [Candidatus Norongarragalina meridionalis]|nr:50S ribosomal protein L24 [Candidatus Norongarragalina meridionalis]
MKFNSSVTKQPRKKRKTLANLALHSKRRLVHAHLSKELRTQLKKRSIALKKGDSVRIVRGRFKKRSGKIVEVDLRRMLVFVEGVIIKKQGGREKTAPIQPSNVVITALEKRDEKKKQKK